MSFFFTIDDFELDVPGSKRLDADVGTAITGADLELTIEGASTLTLTVEDENLALWRSDTLQRWAWGETGLGDDEAWVRKGRAVDCTVAGIPFRLVKVSKAATTLTLVFEDREVAYLRQHKGARKASRAKVTRAEFIALLVSEVQANGGVPVYAPEVYRHPPIAKANDKLTDAQRRDLGHPGIGKGAGITVKGADANTTQVRILERALDVARTHNAGPKATLALILAIIVESQARNLSGGDADSAGVLQYRVGNVGRAHARDPEWCFADFLLHGATGAGGAITLARQHPDWSAGDIAAACQGPRADLRGEYEKWHDEGEKIVRAYGGAAGQSLGQYHKSYEFARGKDENTWDASGRLVDEVAWRRFMRGHDGARALWVVSEDWLFRQKHELVLRENEDGVGYLDGDLDMNARWPVSQITTTAHAGVWTAWPGMVALVPDHGPMAGRWLVSTLRRSLLDTTGALEVTLRKPIPAKPEPASDVVDRDATNAADGARGKVVVVAGADRPGVKTHRWVLDFLALAAGQLAKTIFVTTGSNHSIMSSSGLRSDHADGNAADLGSVKNGFEVDGKGGDALAKACARVLGVGVQAVTGTYERHTWRHGDKTYSVQVLWKVAGHHDHVHVGVRPA